MFDIHFQPDRYLLLKILNTVVMRIVHFVKIDLFNTYLTVAQN